MRHHFHRCGNLRVIALEVSDLSRARTGGSQILEELCAASQLARCVGLAECELLAPAQKRELLAARATRLREREGGASSLADVPDPRGEELLALRSALLDERDEIVEQNRRKRIEAAGALRRNPRPVGRSEESELAAAGVSVFYEDEWIGLGSARLDAIDRALDAMESGRYGDCARCVRPIEIARLRVTPDTVVCTRCAREALPEPAPIAT